MKTREIKFRAWDKQVKKFCNWEHAVTIDLDGEIYRNRTEDKAPFLILMQYTGLKDKNGKEIYEGDIVKLVKNLREQGEESMFTVKFQNAMFQPFFAIKGKDVTIRGNIYENPDLLK